MSIGTTTATVPAPEPPAPLPTVSVPSPPTPASVVAEGATLVNKVIAPATAPEPEPPGKIAAPGAEGATGAGATPGGATPGGAKRRPAAARGPSSSLLSQPRPARARGAGPARRALIRRGKHIAVATHSQRARPTAARAGTDPKPARATGAAHAGATHRSGASDPLGVIGSLPLPVPVPDWSKPIILALALLALAFGVRWALTSRRARRLQRERAALAQDIGALQAALVPPAPADLVGVTVTVAYRPADGPGAGGDFYDVFELAPRRLAVILGDVAGHGRAALRDAALTRYTVRAYLQAGIAPRAALALAGTTLGQGSELMATVAVAIFDGDSGCLTYALAGHPPPLLRGVDLPEPPNVCCSAPLGSHLPTGRRQTMVALPLDAAACFYTDGLPDARCSSGEKLLGRRRLRKLVESLEDPGDAGQLLDAVSRAAVATPDDMAACIVSCRSTAAGAVRSYAEELELDRVDLEGDRLLKFLRATGVAADAVEHAVRLARETVGQHDTAVMRVRSIAGAVTVSLAPPDGRPTARLDELPREERAGTQLRFEQVRA